MNNIYTLLSAQIILIFGVILNLLLSLMFKQIKPKHSFLYTALILFIAMSAAGFNLFTTDGIVEKISLKFNSLSAFFCFTISVAAFLNFISFQKLNKKLLHQVFFYNSNYLMLVFALLMLTVSNNLIAVVFLLEIALISLAFMNMVSKTIRSIGAGLKILIAGALSGGIMLLGISFLAGYFGSLDFAQIETIMAQNPSSFFLSVSIIMLMFGSLIAAGIFPYKNLFSKVVEGSTYQNIFALTTLLPLGFLALLFKFSKTFINIGTPAQIFLAVISLIAVIISAVTLTRQSSIKGFISNLHSLQMGVIIFSVSLLTVNSITAALFYTLIYVLSTVGILSFMTVKEVNKNFDDSIYSLKGLGYANPYMSAMFGICLLTVAGVIPTAGLWSKFYLIEAALRVGLWASLPVFILLLCFAISAFFCIKILFILYDTEDMHILPSKNMFTKRTTACTIVLAISVLILTVGFFFSGGLFSCLKNLFS